MKTPKASDDKGIRPMLREVQACPPPADPNGPKPMQGQNHKYPWWYGGKGRPSGKC